MDYYPVIRESIAAELAIPPDTIRPDTLLFEDLEADSLDFLNIVFRIEQKTATKIPVTEWLNERNERPDAFVRFSIRDLCDRLERLSPA